jgi:hypothetical protein
MGEFRVVGSVNAGRKSEILFLVAVSRRLLVAALWPASAFAAVTMYSATLTGAQEVPPNASVASAVAIVFLDDVANTIAVNVNFSNLSSLANGAHIHNAVAGVNGPIVFPLANVPAATSGSIPQQTFAITPALIVELQAGRLYVNIHSVNFSNGEIRGQLALVAAPSCAVSSNIIQDGGFELNTDTFENPNWTSSSTYFGSALCTVAVCGTGFGAGAPRTGNGWVWFDGTSSGSAETGTAQQTRTLPVGATVSLSYWERFGWVASPTNSIMTVTVDASVVRPLPNRQSPTPATSSARSTCPRSPTGQRARSSFNYSRPSGADSDNALVDDVTLAITACPSTGGAASPRCSECGLAQVRRGRTFDLPLAATPLNPTTEPRQGPAQTQSRVHVQQPDYRRDGGDYRRHCERWSAGTFSGKRTVIVGSSLEEVSNQQYVTIALTNVADSLGGTGGELSVAGLGSCWAT